MYDGCDGLGIHPIAVVERRWADEIICECCDTMGWVNLSSANGFAYSACLLLMLMLLVMLKLKLIMVMGMRITMKMRNAQAVLYVMCNRAFRIHPIVGNRRTN